MKRDPFPVVFGVIVTTVLSGTLVIAGLKAGITPGVSPLVILFAWGAFTRKIAAGGGTKFLNIAQVAGSAGMAITAGVIFTAPLVQILFAQRGIAALLEQGIEVPRGLDGNPVIGPELLALLETHGMAVPGVEVWTLILLSVAGALVGFGFVGLGTKKFLTDPTLPAPEARACETMIEAAVARPDERPALGRSLYAGLIASFVAPFLAKLGAATEHVVLWSKSIAGPDGDRKFQIDLPFTPIYIGIGGLLTLSTALLVFAGAMLRLVGDYMLAAGVDMSDAAAVAAWPQNSMRWVGGAAMTAAVAYSLYRFMGARLSGEGKDDPLVEVDKQQLTLQRLSILAGLAIILAWVVSKDGLSTFSIAMTIALVVTASLMVVLGAILSLQIGSSASPVSGTIFVTTLVLCVTAIAVGRTSPEDVLLLTPLLVGACVAVCTANDSSQDYKTMQLCGVRVQEGFLAQLLGLLAGCVAVPVVLYVAHNAYVLGSPELNAPQGQLFATLIDGLLLSDNSLPWSPIIAGLVIGVGAVVMDVAGQQKGLQLPAMALAVGIYLPPYLGVGILIGAAFRWFGERGRGQSGESILAAAGLITGAALFELLLGISIVGFAYDPAGLQVFGATPSWILNAVAVAGIAGLGAILYVNSRRAR